MPVLSAKPSKTYLIKNNVCEYDITIVRVFCCPVLLSKKDLFSFLHPIEIPIQFSVQLLPLADFQKRQTVFNSFSLLSKLSV